MGDVIDVRLSIYEEGADDEVLRRLAGYLKDDLCESEIGEAVRMDHPDGPAAPPDTRGVDLETVGAVLVTVQASVEALAVIATTVRNWLGRSPVPSRGITVRIGGYEIEVGAATPVQQQQLVDSFVAAVAAASDDNREQD